jgi:hypothetical protein
MQNDDQIEPPIHAGESAAHSIGSVPLVAKH